MDSLRVAQGPQAMRRRTRDLPREKRVPHARPENLEGVLADALARCCARYGPQPPYESTHAEWERFRALTERMP